jgi:hypothetical protein
MGKTFFSGACKQAAKLLRINNKNGMYRMLHG